MSGTGIAPAVAIMEFFVPAAALDGHRPDPAGNAHGHGCTFRPHDEPRRGRGDDVGPACPTQRPSDLIRRVAVPLLAGGVVLVASVLLGLI